MKAFKQKQLLSAKKRLLPYSEFKLFRDIENPQIPDDKIAGILKHAEALLDTSIPILPASLYREYVTNGNRSNYEDIYFLRRDMAVTLAAAEAYENKGRFTEKLMDVVWAIMEESTWMIPAPYLIMPLS